VARIVFTGERLNDDAVLYGVDLERHRAAYHFAIERAPREGGRVLDLGCGSGYGTSEIAAAHPSVVGIDRIMPDPECRKSGASFLRADLNGIPLAPQSFDLIVSFQVIEHLEDPTVYLNAIRSLLRPGGTALITTPNLLQSDKVNPFHVHEYEAEELRQTLLNFFDDVEMRGVGAMPAVALYYKERLRRIALIMKLDPLGLRNYMPRSLIDWLFGKFSVIVRRMIKNSGEGLPEATIEDFPVEAADEDSLDLFAICKQPRDPAA